MPKLGYQHLAISFQSTVFSFLAPGSVCDFSSCNDQAYFSGPWAEYAQTISNGSLLVSSLITRAHTVYITVYYGIFAYICYIAARVR